jgi:hypothetical protein
MRWITNLWQGEMPLWKAFWVYGVTMSVLLYLATVLAANGILVLVFFFIFSPSVPFNVTWLFAAILLPGVAYQVLSSVGIWRSADKYSGRRVNSVMARAAALAYLAFAVLAINIFLQVASEAHYR